MKEKNTRACHQEEPLDEYQRLTRVREQVAEHTLRVARLGHWEDRVAPESLLVRLPSLHGSVVVPGQGGFDAGIACALDLIPRERQDVAAALHAAYTPEVVEQVRKETQSLDPDSATTWWLAACHVCEEGPGDLPRLLSQLEKFERLADDPQERLRAAQEEYALMTSSFELTPEGFALAVRDGGMQGAYLAGYDVAGMHAPAYALWFVGTFRRTLGLESFPWSEPGDPQGPTPEAQRGRSGPVSGSTQFVKCASEEEFHAVVLTARPRD